MAAKHGGGDGAIRGGRQAGLDPEVRALVELCAAVASRDPAAIDERMEQAARAAVPEQVEEALLQSYLFLGFPAALTAISAWRKRVEDPGADRDPLAATSSVADWTRRGEEVCASVYGRAYRQLRRNVQRVHPAMDRWMITEGYGKVLGRPGLGLADRELCIVALLAVGGWEPQLHSHLRGALHAAAPARAVQEALEIGLERANDQDWADRAMQLWNRVRERHAGRDAIEPSPPR